MHVSKSFLNLLSPIGNYRCIIWRSIHPHRKIWLFNNTRVPTREYNTTKQNLREQYEKQKYDQLLREQVIKATLQSNPNYLNGNSSLKDNRRLPLRTILLLILGSSTMTMGVYVVIQFIKFKQDGKDRLVFLPLWFNLNWFFQSKYSFPKGLKYLDKEYYDYSTADMSQSNMSHNGSDMNNFTALLEDENIKYKVLEELSLNTRIRQMFKLPLNITLQKNKFNIWIQTKYPTISGFQISMENKINRSINIAWAIHLIKYHTIISDVLVLVGLKLDRLKPQDDLQLPVVEKSANVRKNLNTDKEYDIFFTGEFVVRDKNQVEMGSLTYKGMLDFDHLMINRGVKLVEMDLILDSNSSESVKYKIL